MQCFSHGGVVAAGVSYVQKKKCCLQSTSRVNMRCDKSVSHKKECCNSAKEHSVTLPTKENYIVPPNTASHVYSNTGYWTGKLHFSQDGGGGLVPPASWLMMCELAWI